MVMKSGVSSSFLGEHLYLIHYCIKVCNSICAESIVDIDTCMIL